MESLEERSINFQNKIMELTGEDLSILTKNALNHAFLHPSLANELSLTTEYERLEFLGDAIINAIIASELCNEFQTCSEGRLSKMRAVLVSNEKLGQLSEFIHLLDFLCFPKKDGQVLNIEKEVFVVGKTSGRAFEALFGALYLELGFDNTKKLLKKIIISWEKANSQKWFDQEQLLSKDVKSRLQEKLHQLGLENPEYNMIEKQFCSGQEKFVMNLVINGIELQRASAFSKKEAEKIIAKNILDNWAKFESDFEKVKKGDSLC